MIFIFVFAGLSILIIGHEFGHFFASKIFGVEIDEFGFGYPPRIFGKKIGKTLWSINALPFGGFVKIRGENGSEEASDTREGKNFSNKPALQRGAILLAGVFMNVVIGFIIFTAVFMIGSPKEIVISRVSNNSPAYNAGIKENNIIKSSLSGGESISSFTNTESFVSFVGRHISDDITLTIKDGNAISSYVLRGREHPPEGEGALGIELVSLGFERVGFFSAMYQGFQSTIDTLWQVVKAFTNLFLTIFVNPDVIKNIAGPVGIFAIAGQAGSFGFVYFLQFLALVSLNLAVLNFIPFPALDGGRVLMLVIEKIKGSPVSLRMQSYVNMAGFFLLIGLMLFVTFQDVTKLFK